MNHYLITLKNPPIFEFPAPNLKTKTLFTNNSTSFSLSKQLHTQQVKINRKKKLKCSSSPLTMAQTFEISEIER